MKKFVSVATVLAGLSMIGTGSAYAACSDISRAEFEAAANTAATATDSFGFGLPMWASMVDETGTICHVYSTDSGTANTGSLAGNSAWLGSRVISAQKANTANAFSLNGLAIATGGVYVAVQPGGSLYGLQHSNPVDASTAYAGDSNLFGTATDPLTGKNIGGVNVFGGGVPLYKNGVKVGGIGASGDTSCRDHAFAWKMRDVLGMGTPSGATDVTVLKLVKKPKSLGEQPVCGVNDPTAKNGGGTSVGIGN